MLLNPYIKHGKLDDNFFKFLCHMACDVKFVSFWPYLLYGEKKSRG